VSAGQRGVNQGAGKRKVQGGHVGVLVSAESPAFSSTSEQRVAARWLAFQQRGFTEPEKIYHAPQGAVP